MKREDIDDLGMLLVSIIFGCSYVFQAKGAEYLSPLAFNIGKYLLGLITIAPLCIRKTNTSRKDEIIFGAIVGTLLFGFSNLQQVAASTVAAGKIGFITSMYIVEVPVVNYIFFKKKINGQIILSIILAIVGLLFLCDLNDLDFKTADLLVIVCSMLLTGEIIVLERYCHKCDVFKLNFYSFLTTLVLCVICLLINGEQLSIDAYKQAYIPVIYVGIFCSTVACCIQTYCQQTLDSTICSLIMSLESLFSVISGYLILNESLTKSEIVGCIFMFVGVILCVTGQKMKKKKKNNYVVTPKS